MHAPPRIDGLYVHVPFCDGKCSYCAFYSVPYAAGQAQAWLGAVEKEAEQLAAEAGRIAPQTVYFGGGTPTLLPEAHIEALVQSIRRALFEPDWSPRGGIEWTVEANPGSLAPRLLRRLEAMGVNRISLGVQSLQDDALAMLGRRHRVSDVEFSVAAIRASGIENWGVDMIACVPGVEEESWAGMLRRVTAWEPKHVSVYALTAEEGAALTDAIHRGATALQDGERQLRMLAIAEETLGEAGFLRYEISNYAKPGFACKHNLACWQGGNYLGLGCAAASRVGHKRWLTAANLKSYVERLAADGKPDREVDLLTSETDAVERMVFGLRMTTGVDLVEIRRTTDCPDALVEGWGGILSRLSREGLVERQGCRWRLTPRGRDLADHVAVELMP